MGTEKKEVLRSCGLAALEGFSPELVVGGVYSHWVDDQRVFFNGE